MNNTLLETVTLFVSGDFCPAWGGGALLQSDSARTIFGDLYDTIKVADVAITNLECPLTQSNKSIEKIGPNLKAHSRIASLLKSVGFGLVTLANNHIYDYGQEGLEETLDVLEKNKIAYVGADLSLKDAQKPFFTICKGIRLAIINIAEVEFSCADSDHGGANPMHLIDNIYQIQEARKYADHVILIIHGGHEHYHYPSPETQKRYRFYAEQGVSAVIAHHTHCVGGYESWNGVPIFYSLGNFFFPARSKMVDSWYEGMALLLKVTKDSVAYEILPYEQCKNDKMVISQESGVEIIKKIGDISRDLKNQEVVYRHWKQFVEQRQYYLARILGFGSYKTMILCKMGLLRYFCKQSQMNMILQVARCVAHREVTKDLLSNFLK